MSKKNNNELTVKQASSFLGLSTRSILNYIRSKEIEAIKVGKRWFIKEASLQSFAKKYGFTHQDISDSDNDKEEIDAESHSLKQKSTKNKKKHIVSSLRLYTIAQEAFIMKEWGNLDNKPSQLNPLEERLTILKLESLELIGAGYLSFNTIEKRELYSRSRQKVGAILALLYIDEKIQEKWSKEITFIEEELLSAYSALIRKMETISEK